ncbi:MAG TPA: anti-sigma factor [Candidatus Solibacter sp.]|jgi:anti-sigma-K factor RskA|nr:anti-sigma factor [Candidatus Solibacter sp.]
MTGHAETQELLAPYALGAVSTAEADQVREHLPGCEICRMDLARLSEVVSALPLAVDEAQPRARLKQQILGIARGDAAAAARFGEADLPINPGPAIHLPGERSARFWRSVPRWGPVAAAAAIAALLLTWNLQLQTQVNNSRDLAARSVATAPMKSRSGGDVGQITYLAQQHVALVSLRGMVAPAGGRTYEVWIVDAHGRATPAGIFLPDGDGSKLLVLTQDIGRKSIAVSEEPAGGSAQPTSLPIISGAI